MLFYGIFWPRPDFYAKGELTAPLTYPRSAATFLAVSSTFWAPSSFRTTKIGILPPFNSGHPLF